MKIKGLTLKNFRNLEDSYIDFSLREIVFSGNNGQGKTNILEALYILCYGTSFRTDRLSECIKHGKSDFFLKTSFSEDSDDKNGTDTEVSIFYENSGKKKNKLIKINGNEVKDRKNLIYRLPCIVFSHEDIEFIRGEPEYRRRFFNQIMTMYNMEFFDNLRSYNQVLRQRNAAIRSQRSDLTDLYNERLARYGKLISEERAKVCTSFNSIFPDLYSLVSAEENSLSIEYRPSWPEQSTEEEIIEKLVLQKEKDLNAGTTTSGPHRDRFIITDKNGVFANSASTGQMRLASIVMRIAQAVFFRQKTDINPVLLVDDVLLELDSEKRIRCFSAFGKYSQAFFTFLPDEKYFSEKDSRTFMQYEVKEGKAERK